MRERVWDVTEVGERKGEGEGERGRESESVREGEGEKESFHERKGERSTNEGDGEIKCSATEERESIRERGEVWGIEDEGGLAKMEVREFSLSFIECVG